ncbi:hypothetical protein O181_069019 [Austropuccinia psidii MF-1]|uniref:Uncharacterized protein n=1 Tax=Austropuccinia psidii MF-1 TaxID=1389203 RepID=A0A9Q3EY12_9BASI|nr:hypothetical protein [Austropuccinia psidii MF-1]
MSLKAQTHFNTICNVWVISPHWLAHPHLIRPNSSHAYVPAPPSRCDSDTAPPSPSSPLLTLSHPCPSHLYAHVVPSQHASDTASHPYACVVPSRHAPDTAYHPYARGVPS